LNSGYRNADGSILAVGEEKIALTWGTSGKDVVFCLVSQDPAVRAAPKFFLRTDSVVTDLAFSEVDPELFATGQENGTTRLWRIPAGALAQDLVQPETELRGVHKKKVTSVAFSPVASGVIATGGGEFAAVWVDGEARFVLPHTGAAVFSVAWSPDGALLVTTTADKKTRVWDPRKSVDAPVLEYASCHDGVKAASALFVSKVRFLVFVERENVTQRSFLQNKRTILLVPGSTRTESVSCNCGVWWRTSSWPRRRWTAAPACFLCSLTAAAGWSSSEARATRRCACSRRAKSATRSPPSIRAATRLCRSSPSPSSQSDKANNKQSKRVFLSSLF
jgi:WD40 repeat protein